MRKIFVRVANQSFSRLITAAELGETIVITRNGRPVARIVPPASHHVRHPHWASAFAALEKSLQSKQDTGYRVGTITERNKYEDA